MPHASSQQAEVTLARSQHQPQQQTGLALLPAGDADAAESSGRSQTAGDSASIRQSSSAGMAQVYQFWMFGDLMLLLSGSAEKRQRKDYTFRRQT